MGGDLDLSRSLDPEIGSERSSGGGVRLFSQSFIIDDIVLFRCPGVSLSSAGH